MRHQSLRTPRKNSPVQAILAASAAVLLATPAFAETFTYTPSNDSTDLWSFGTNWSVTPVSAASTRLTFVGDNTTVLADGLWNYNTNDFNGRFQLGALDLQGTGPVAGGATINIANVSPSTGFALTQDGTTGVTVNLNALAGASGLTYNVLAPVGLNNSTLFQGNGTATFNFTSGLNGGISGVQRNVTKTGSSILNLGGNSTVNNLSIGANATGGSIVGLSGSTLTVGTGASSTLAVGVTSGTGSSGTLDLSAASRFTANVGTFQVGVNTTSNNATWSGTLKLAANSNITAATSIVFGDNGNAGNGNNGSPSFNANVTTATGGATTFQTPILTIGGNKASGSFTLGIDETLNVSGINGGRTALGVGNYVNTEKNRSTGTSFTSVMDLSGGTFNGTLSSLSVGVLNNIAGTSNGSGSQTATLTLSTSASNHLDISGAGTVVTIANRIGGTGTAKGTVTIGNLDASSSIESTDNGTAVMLGVGTNSNGTLNLDGGTLKITTTGIAIGGGTGTSTVNFNGTVLRAGANSSAFIQGLTNASVQAGGAKFDTNSFNVTLGQVLTSGAVGDGGLTKLGAGTLTLSGTHGYVGATTVNGGTLALDFSAVNAPAANIINSTSALVLGGGTLSVRSFADNSTTAASQQFNGTTLNAGASGVAISLPNANPVAVALGAITRNAGGTVDFTLPANAQSSTNRITTTTANANIAGGQQTILGGYAIVGGDTWAVSGTGNTPGNITGLTNYASTGTTALSAAAGKDVTVSASGNNSLGGALTVNSVRFDAAGASNVNAAGGALTIATGGILVTPNVGNNTTTINGGTITSGNGADLIIIQNNASGSMSVGSQIAGNIGLTKAGSGLLTLSGNNTYTGPTNVTAGTLAFSTPNALGNGGAVGVNAGARIELSGEVAVDGHTLTLNGTGGGATTSGALRSTSGSNTWSGDVTLGDADTRIGTYSGATLVLPGTISGTGSLTVKNVVSGTDASAGTGTVILGGFNSYTGGTTLSGGVLALESSAALGNTGRIAFDGGTLRYGLANSADYSSRFSTAPNQAFSIDTNGQNVVFGSSLTSTGGNLTKSGDGTLQLTAQVQGYTGTTTVNGGTLELNPASANSATNGLFGSTSLVINNGGTVQVDSDNALTGNGNAAGNFVPIIINAGGTLTSNGDQSTQIKGLLTLNGGTLTYRGSAGNSVFGNWNLISGVTVNGGANTSTISAPGVTLGQAGGTVFNVSSGAASGIDLDVTGTIIHTAGAADTGLTKTGNGVMRLAGFNTYTSPTNIEAGTLIVSGSLYGTSQVTVQNGATLSGEGIITPGGTGYVDVANGGIIAPGSGIGTLTINRMLTTAINAVSLSSDAKFSFELNTGLQSDTVAIAFGLGNDIAFSGNTINFSDLSAGTLAFGRYTLFTADVSGAYAGLVTDSNGFITSGLAIGTGLQAYPGSTLQVSGNDIVLNVIPEPGSVANLLVGLGAVLGMYRRRK